MYTILILSSIILGSAIGCPVCRALRTLGLNL